MANLDLRLLGQRLRLDRIVPGFVPTHLLHARATSPFGQFLSEGQVGELWASCGGEGELPAWFVLGSQDTPTGTLWHLAFAPVATPAELERDPSPELLPEGLWVHRLQARQPKSGWSLRETPVGDLHWIGLWEDSCCLRLVCAAPSEAVRERAFLERRWSGCAGAPRHSVTWNPPSPAQAQALLEADPQAALLPEELRRRRREERSERRARRGTALALGLIALVTLGLWGARALARLRLDAAHSHGRTLGPSLARLQRLAQERTQALGQLRSQAPLLRPNRATDLWLGRILSACPPARLEALRLQGGDSAVTAVRLDLEVDDWSELNPLLERLRRVPGVHAASFENRGRQDGHVRAQARLEGAPP